MRRTRAGVVAFLGVLALLASGCGGDGPDGLGREPAAFQRVADALESEYADGGGHVSGCTERLEGL